MKTLLLIHKEYKRTTADLIDDWAKNVWDKCPGNLRNPHSMLFLDAFLFFFFFKN